MKEAVVFVLDGYASMGLPVDDTDDDNDDKNNNKQSRFDMCRDAIISMISDLMLQSKTNEVSVIVTKTNTTHHHQMAADEQDNPDVPFPNLTELTPGIVRPSPDLLRRIQNLQVNPMSNNNMGGDLCDALLMAADAQYERGTQYKFQRKMVVFTDAGHHLRFDVPAMLTMVDALREMNCTIVVIGWGFATSGTYASMLPAVQAAQAPHESLSSMDSKHSSNKRVKLEVAPKAEQQEEEDGDHKNTVAPDLPPTSRVVSDALVKQEPDYENDNEDDEQVNWYTDKGDREACLLSLTEKTGGQVLSIGNVQQMLQVNHGKKIQKSVKNKCKLHIAPNLVLDCRSFLLLKKCDIPTTKKEAVLVDEDGAALMDPYGNERTELFSRKILYVDADHPDEIVDEYTTAVLFGSSLVPMSTFDYEGLKSKSSGCRVQLLGYLERDKIPLSYISGPPSCLTGLDSVMSCAGIAALSRALMQEDKVGIGTFYKSNRSAQPILVAIYPFEDRLLTLQIPFEGEVRNLALQPLPEEVPDKAKVCDALIDSLMLDDDVLESGSIPSFFDRSFNQTKLHRALHPGSDKVVVTRDVGRTSTPQHVLKGARDALQAFQSTFPLEKVQEKKSVTKTAGKKVLTHKDFL